MKETKSLKVLLVFIFLVAVIYNVMLDLMLKSFDTYHMENIFFVVRYAHQSNPDDLNIAPQFMNWIFILSFVFISVMLWVRIYINKEMKIKGVAR
ncbi:MAG: hypothetical protein A2Y45_02915 [Tenericutes bacterium GWC2_34_14]|nr:MAG: hypothetical protein A2Z84_03865 [Tenericutes bacterium GWA2_35_7]OHE29004.1 MAG: hypothetical protein A2Y45_02915 [Tenericutes bacterium GWC2_34_14]OHE33957.1 MAG: hypothetical protein A2012_06455 [Tenericutes bacterium GWE2_34_108]OHE35290.1 MAG: hypothetical protein A2Y46_04175 [Tenericutes bacterium GWF1_35_14]OHE38323.1 MAG: hypothetical protein A2Y44_03485 [Tenericutes bacterium GWF2_35_184]OHE42498.1 MAG: hypothetical protein A3K26_03800 [Tenericutes bacterium RIFOXYA12_FULL_35_